MRSLRIVHRSRRGMEESRFHTYRWRRVYRRAPDECAVPPLDIGIRAMQLSPYRAGVAGPCHTRLLTSPAFQPCCCSLALSGLGKAVASESSALNSGLLRRQFLPCVTWRTLSPHTAHERGILWDISISPAPRHIHRGQLCAFAGYLCTASLPSPYGPSPCSQLSCAPTTMPHLTACRASEFRMGLPTSTLHPPGHPLQALPCSQQRTHARRGRWRV